VGELHRSALGGLVISLQRHYQIENFIETGTYMGECAAWAAQRFARVWTIEIRADYQVEARKKTGEPPNVKFLLGNSADLLAGVCAELQSPAICWLDAHSGGGYFGPGENCPLLSEIDVIACAPQQHILFIDDARAFVAAPPPPFDYRKWPALEDIMQHLQARHRYHVAMLIDCLICVPQAARALLAQFAFTVRPKI
jgi:hypothetical protein